MIFWQLGDPEYSIYLRYDKDGSVCYRADTPIEIQHEFEDINREYQKYMPASRDFILMLDGQEPSSSKKL